MRVPAQHDRYRFIFVYIHFYFQYVPIDLCNCVGSHLCCLYENVLIFNIWRDSCRSSSEYPVLRWMRCAVSQFFLAFCNFVSGFRSKGTLLSLSLSRPVYKPSEFTGLLKFSFSTENCRFRSGSLVGNGEICVDSDEFHVFQIIHFRCNKEIRFGFVREQPPSVSFCVWCPQNVLTASLGNVSSGKGKYQVPATPGTARAAPDETISRCYEVIQIKRNFTCSHVNSFAASLKSVRIIKLSFVQIQYLTSFYFLRFLL